MVGAPFIRRGFRLLMKHKPSFRVAVSLSLSLLLCLAFTRPAIGHGGVAFEDDLCVINVGFLQAHFTVFQPQTREDEEYCEDIPDVTDAVFVMEYLHGLLNEMYVDFRIVRDVNDVGRFASWEDIEAIENLEAATVYYQSPRIEPGGYYRAGYQFNTRGTYIGVVTAEHPTEDRNYNAVFYFRVGGRDWGTIPLFIALLILLQLGYWVSSGGYRKFMLKHSHRWFLFGMSPAPWCSVR